MRRTLTVDSLPTDITVDQAVEAACAEDIAFIEARLRQGTSVLVECDKELALHLYLAVRNRLRKLPDAPKIQLIDGRPRNEEEAGRSGLANTLAHLTDAIRGSVERLLLVLPHLDVLATTHTGLTFEAREIIPLLYENPEALLLGFRDPSFPLPRVIEQVFGAVRTVVGVPRDALPRLITRREAQAIRADAFDPFGLYKYLSGQNPVRCRKLLGQLALRREAMPGRDQVAAIYRLIRQQTATDGVDLPQVDLERDVGGYPEVKQRLREEIIDLVRRRDALDAVEDIDQLEALLPRGIIFHGPPGTGKTWFAKALATALDATVLVVSGPELKSKWVGESEQNLRRIFRQARAAAPAVIVFDELDAFAQRRGTYSGSGVEHSMVNQLLTEMDGFRRNEMVFVVGTTNFLESVDGALLRPGRFEFLIEIPAPEPADRRAIIGIYDRKLGLGLAPGLIDHLVRRTEGLADRTQGLPYTGDHLYAVCRALKRQALRTGDATFTTEDVDRALERRSRRPVVLSTQEERVIAVHEAGHALLASLLPGATPPERISITADMEGALGYVLRAARARPYAITSAEMRAEICVGLGGYAAERRVLGDVSIGAYADLKQVTSIARSMVVDYGMSSAGVRASLDQEAESEARRARVDAEIDALITAELQRADALLAEHAALHAALVDALLIEKVLEGPALHGALGR
ncbi:MAG: AAA family ATPase [Myxococcales bacterium]|nr:AAA family ATPase [Myxococcales bacterium]MCB9548354.1 AAA family ATPase [Myxococcales bacterium]